MFYKDRARARPCLPARALQLRRRALPRRLFLPTDGISIRQGWCSAWRPAGFGDQTRLNQAFKLSRRQSFPNPAPPFFPYSVPARQFPVPKLGTRQFPKSGAFHCRTGDPWYTADPNTSVYRPSSPATAQCQQGNNPARWLVAIHSKTSRSLSQLRRHEPFSQRIARKKFETVQRWLCS
jgi:hypothetical protein